MLTITRAQVQTGQFGLGTHYRIPSTTIEKQLLGVKVGKDLPSHLSSWLLRALMPDGFQTQVTFPGKPPQTISKDELVNWVSYSVPKVFLRRTGDNTYEIIPNRAFI